MNYAEFKKLFLDLTEWTIPFGMESKLLPLLPKGGELDQWGNYYITIGEAPTTLFTTHLDTFSDKYEKVKHVFKGETISTDGSTILGGDNKLGTTILCYLISKNVPGIYVFFRGEEPVISGGLWGSRKAAQTEMARFINIKRAVAFDRRETGSIITRQAGRPCCSNEFVTELSLEFKKQNMNFDNDPTGYYTDTASFMSLIPECTNISAGGWGEHTTKEYVKLDYTYKVAQAASRINWESLPTARKIKPTGEEFNDEELELLEWVNYLFENYDFQIENIETASKGEVLTIGSYFESSPFTVMINNNSLFLNSKKINIHVLRNVLADYYGCIFNPEHELFEYDEELDVFWIEDKPIKLMDILKNLEFNKNQKTAKFTPESAELKDDLGFPMRGNDLIEWVTSIVKAIQKAKTKNKVK